MKQLIKIQGSVERGATFIGIMILLFLMFLTVGEVVGRYVFNHPVPGSYEISELMMIGVVFLALAHVQALKQHIRIDIIAPLLKPKIRLLLDLCAYLLGLFLFIIMAWQGVPWAWQSWSSGEYYVGLLEVPLWPAKSLFVIGISLLCIRLFLHFIEDLRSFVKRTLV